MEDVVKKKTKISYHYRLVNQHYENLETFTASSHHLSYVYLAPLGTSKHH